MTVIGDGASSSGTTIGKRWPSGVTAYCARAAVVLARTRIRPLTSGTANVLGEDLDGDDAVEACVACLVHLAQAARPERELDFIRAEKRAGRERHVAESYRNTALNRRRGGCLRSNIEWY